MAPEDQIFLNRKFLISFAGQNTVAMTSSHDVILLELHTFRILLKQLMLMNIVRLILLLFSSEMTRN